MKTGCQHLRQLQVILMLKNDCLKGLLLTVVTYKNHIDGYNMVDYLSGKVEESPRK